MKNDCCPIKLSLSQLAFRREVSVILLEIAQPCMSYCLQGNLAQFNMAAMLTYDPGANEAVFTLFTVSITVPLICLSGIVLENFFCLCSYLFVFHK